MPKYVPAPLGYVEQVEEQLYGNYPVAQAKAKAIIKRRAKTINIRFRRSQSVSDTAIEIAGLEGMERLPDDWKPPVRDGGPFYPPQKEQSR